MHLALISRLKTKKKPTHPLFLIFKIFFCCCLKGRPCLKTHFSHQSRLSTGLEEPGIASAILFQTHTSVKTHPLKTWKICPQITFSPKFLPDPPCDRWSWRKRQIRKRQELAWTGNYEPTCGARWDHRVRRRWQKYTRNLPESQA